MMRTSFDTIADYLPEKIRSPLLLIDAQRREKVSEVRLYCRRSLALVYPDTVKFLCRDGTLSPVPEKSDLIVSEGDIASTVERLCHYSIHSRSRELKNGYFVIENGVRVGVGGTYSGSREGTMSDFSSLNFRVAREVRGCAESLIGRIQFGSPILICGGVNTGKTTLLRDICRIYGRYMKCALVDERNEISAAVGGAPTCDVGELTDIIIGTDRVNGIRSAIRTLSPAMIFCDEISSDDDASAIISGHGSGVRFTATVHAASPDDLKKRRFVGELVDSGVFEYAVFLGDVPSEIREIRRLRYGD